MGSPFLERSLASLISEPFESGTFLFDTPNAFSRSSNMQINKLMAMLCAVRIAPAASNETKTMEDGKGNNSEKHTANMIRCQVIKLNRIIFGVFSILCNFSFFSSPTLLPYSCGVRMPVSTAEKGRERERTFEK